MTPIEKIVNYCFKTIRVEEFKKERSLVNKEIEHINKLIEKIETSFNKFFYWLLITLVASVTYLTNELISILKDAINTFNNPSKIQDIQEITVNYTSLIETVGMMFDKRILIIVLATIGFLIVQTLRKNDLLKRKRELLKTFPKQRYIVRKTNPN